MSENESDKEQQQQMEKIFICADVWLGVFAFLCPFDVGLKMALISDRLDVLVDVHFKSREWSFGWMEIRRADDGNGAEMVNRSRKRLSIPQEPLPGKVTGFEWITISYIDQTVIEFLERIRPLFDSSGTNVWIHSGDQSRSLRIIRQNILPLVSGNVCGFLLHAHVLYRLRKFSPAILRNCANLRSINSYGLFPEFPAKDNAGAWSAEALAKWLITPRGDGLPKMLRCFYSRGMEEIKASFGNASESVNFIIRLSSSSGFEPFEMKNNWTGEQLTLRHFKRDIWLLVRCPIGREEDKWTNWEKEAIEWEWHRQRNCIFVNFEDRDIGDGMIEAAKAGPSECKK
uniref:Uncharacterized protein n=1 Tax=Globodera rostochiensis TaxID=31243 RepID=A0A914GT33_GLORO